MARPLCAFVLEPAHRFCGHHGIYVVEGHGGKRYCRGHAGKAGVVIARVGTPRRWLYGGRSAPGGRTWNSDEPAYLYTKGIETVAFEVEAREGTKFNAEEYATAGIYLAVVESVEPYEGTKYQSTEKQTQARITWNVTDGPQAGKKAERLYSPSLNIKSRLHPVFEALTGITPVPGERYDIEAMLVGKPAQIVVMESIGPESGKKRIRVENVLPLAVENGNGAAPAKPKKTKVIEVEDDEDDDLADA